MCFIPFIISSLALKDRDLSSLCNSMKMSAAILLVSYCLGFLLLFYYW